MARDKVESFHQVVGFYFQVTFDFDNPKSKNKALPPSPNYKREAVDVRFQSVSGLDVQLDTESIKEGGENRFEHVIPSRTKYPDLVLKRGLLRPGESSVTDWCITAFRDCIYKPINLEVTLFNEAGDALVYWKVLHAYPKNWKMSELNAEKSEVFIETLELNYNRFVYKKGV